jgi:hypothetical protein
MKKNINSKAQDRKLYQMQRDIKQSELIDYRDDILSIQHYKGTDPRRRQELMDARMIQEDQNAISNLSPNVINRTFKPEGGYFGLRITDEEASRSEPI